MICDLSYDKNDFYIIVSTIIDSSYKIILYK